MARPRDRRVPLLAAVAGIALAGALLWFARREAPQGDRLAPLELPAFDAGRAPERLALLVGIDRYAPGSGLPELDGSINDVRAARALLVGRFGFDPRDVLVLENEHASHEHLVRAFREWLLERAGPETEVVFWFSGHGSYVPDADGDEQDGRDETLLAWDSRAEGRRGSYDLVDDELAALLAALGERTSRATVVTDCCYSGSVLRGDPRAAPKVRFADAGAEPFDPAAVEGFWPEGVPLVSDETDGPRAYVHVAACAPDQLAHEIRDAGDGGGAHGALSFFLLRVLEGAHPDLTYGQVASEAAVRVASSFPGQTVWCKGTLGRRLFSGRFPDQPKGLPARLGSDGKLELRTGLWTGVRVGSELSVRDALSSEPVGTAVVEWTSPTKARAVFSRLEGAPIPGGALRAVEVGRPGGLEPLVVAVEDGPLAERLSGVEACRRVDAPTPGAYRVTVEEGRFALRTPEGLRVWTATLRSDDEGCLDEAQVGLAAAFAREQRHRELLLAAQFPAGIPVAVRFRNATEEDRRSAEPSGVWRDPGLCPVEGAAGREFRARGGRTPEGRYVALLEITNPGTEPFYPVVFSVAEDRSSNLIWPAVELGQDQARVLPGDVRAIPVIVLLDEKWDLERPMRDRYVALALRDAPDVSTFQNERVGLRGAESPTEGWQGLLRAVFPVRHRGSVDLDPAAVGVAVVDLLVDPPLED